MVVAVDQHLADMNRLPGAGVEGQADADSPNNHQSTPDEFTSCERHASTADQGFAHGAGASADEADGTVDGSVRTDRAFSALDALASALEENAEDQRLLAGRLRVLRQSRENGMSWRDALAREPDPGTMQVLSRMLSCLSQASGVLRKELVESLRDENTSIPTIAKMFGVTHQRVSNLLRRTPD